MSNNVIKFKIDNKDSWFELDSKNTVDDVAESLRKCQTSRDKEFILSVNDQDIEIKRLLKEDLFSGKDELSKLKHPYFATLDNIDTPKTKETLKVDKNDTILLFSPHPDDEILGASAYLRHCFVNGYNIKVVYMTSGKSQGGANRRQEEATKGIKLLGGTEENLIFCEMPFYNHPKREVSDSDYKYIDSIISENNPTSVFICADVFDPKATHWRCFDILMKLFSYEKYSQLRKYFYYSVWYWPNDNEYTHILPYEFEDYKLKIYAMLEHQSQLENDFMGNDPRPFYQRATARDKQFGKLYNSAFCEVFYQLKF
jgi:LmbE family N-acetylglucosaminyl deacetylase